MTADEALSLGFVDEISEPLRYAAHARGSYAGYRHTPRELVMQENVSNSQTPQTETPQTEVQSAIAAASNDAAMAALRDRNTRMIGIAHGFRHMEVVRDELVSALADPRMSAEAFGNRVLMRVGAICSPIQGASASTTDGDIGDFVAAASDALAIRAGIKIEKPHPGTRDVRAMGMQDIARACLSRAGKSTSFNSVGSLVHAALTTSDFPLILENTLNKALRGGYETEPRTFEAWTRKVLVPDFREQKRVILGSAPELLPVNEGGEYELGSMDEDRSVPYSVSKFGRMVKLTFETMVNDDLGAFNRIVAAFGQAASRSEADAIYSSFALNSGAGPTMQDGAALFHASHNNIAAASSTIDADALGAARVLLRRQTAVGGGILNLTPRFLLVAPEFEQAAEALLAAASRGITTQADNKLTPAWLAQLQLVVEARLTDAAFYLLTDPAQVDTVERAWLEADNGPAIGHEDALRTDDRTYKIRFVHGNRWLDWRGAVKVPISGG
jgi:hypothetical protein